MMSERDAFSISDDVAGDDTTVVSVAGEIDMKTGPAFQLGLLQEGIVVDVTLDVGRPLSIGGEKPALLEQVLINEIRSLFRHSQVSGLPQGPIP